MKPQTLRNLPGAVVAFILTVLTTQTIVHATPRPYSRGRPADPWRPNRTVGRPRPVRRVPQGGLLEFAVGQHNTAKPDAAR